jgi:RND family efflux transporter MFP subunit
MTMTSFSSTTLVAILLSCGLWAGCSGKTDPAATGGSSAGPAPSANANLSPGSAQGTTQEPKQGAAPAPASAAGKGAPGGPAAGSAPPIGVSTVRVMQRDLPELLTATGTVAPLSSVDVRPQVTSIVTRVHIKEGQFVRKGELMFTLDARTDETNLAKAQAQLARDEAGLADANRQLQRNRELVAQNFISRGALDASQTLVESQSALVAADRAAIEGVRIALSYARITAPSTGRVGAIVVYPGSSVLANQTTLVTVTQLDPINVSFTLPQRHLADVLAALKVGGAAVTATLPEGGAPLNGRLQFVDSAVDASSGTVKVKAVFDNRNARMWPGAYVNVALAVRTIKDAVVIPQAAIIQSARGPIVYSVQGGVAASRPVQLLYAQGDEAAVTGVKPGERIVLDGRQNLRPGSAVIERPPEGAGRPGGRQGGAPGGAGAPPGQNPGQSPAPIKGESNVAGKADPRVDSKADVASGSSDPAAKTQARPSAP